ncbi:MAG TPA: ATP phosphoribosyltransferase regulatory subunit, partial [Opitutus sp.]|nr:ATP phosphoribosyltransferase regulatory subunit [Opitutus sp.]
FFVRLSDRNLWWFYLEALGLDEPRIRTLLSAIDKLERAGEEAFKPYAEKFGPLDATLKEKVHGFLQIKRLDALERALAGIASDRLAGRLAEWRKVLGGLDAMGLSRFVEVDLGVVRGLAYYTGFVFEAFDRKGELRAIAGGGRYNDLVQKLGGPDLPAVGFAIGDVTLGLLLEARGLMPAFVQASDVYCVIGGETERRVAFADVQALRAAGFRVDYPLKDVGFGKQFKLAAESGAKLALIYGADEVAKGVVKIRDLTARTEVEVARDQVAAAVRDFFSQS